MYSFSTPTAKARAAAAGYGVPTASTARCRRTLAIGRTNATGHDVLPTERHAREPMLEAAKRVNLPGKKAM